MAAKRSWLGRVYLDWARFPVVTDRGRANLVASDELAPEPLDTAVEFSRSEVCLPCPLPQQSGAARALTAWVYVTPAGAIDAMVMNNRLQK